MNKQELYDQILLDFANEYNIPVAELGDNFKAEAAVLATALYNVRLRVNEIALNVWVGSADIETLLSVGIDKIGRLPFPAVSGVYQCSTVQIAGETEVIDKGTQFKKGNYVYESLADINPGDDIIIRAITAGTESELSVSDTLTSVSPLSSIQDTITVDSVEESPSDAEDIEDYRADVLNSFTLRPNGGNASDYILWASDVSDIRTVYPYAASGEAGKVKIYCEGISSFQPNGAKIDEVIEAIKYDSDGNGRVLVDLFPFINDTYIVPVQITTVNITLDGGDSGQQTEAEQVIEDYLYNIRPYLPTLNKTRDETKDTITQTALIKKLAENDIVFTGITIKVLPLGGAEQTVTSYQVGDADDPTYYGEIPELGTLTIT
jgi:uncharacterized phage protein gp47/JayE